MLHRDTLACVVLYQPIPPQKRPENHESGIVVVQPARHAPHRRADDDAEEDYRMNRSNHKPATAGDQVARIAVAQFLLLEATVESLSILGERLSGTAREPRSATTREAMIEPFRARYALLRDMMREPTRH